MNTPKTVEIRFERTIPAPVGEVFDAWLDPAVPGSPFHEHDKLIIDAKVDGLFYWCYKGQSHYGRFLEVSKGKKLQHSWVSRHTVGEETVVTVTFQSKGKDTLMTLVHAGLPNEEAGKNHDRGWTFLLGNFVALLATEIKRQA